MSAIQTGFVQGKLSGMKVGSDWPLFYIELCENSLRIFEGNEDPSRPRRQMRTLDINSTDLVYNKDKDKKKDFRFLYERFDGKYIFKCKTPEERTTWVNNLHRMIQRKEYIEKGVLPTEGTYSQASRTSYCDSSPSSSPLNNRSSSQSLPPYTRHSVDSTTPPPPPPHKRDSGFVSGTADARTFNRGNNTCYSGDSVISHGGRSNSGDSAIVHNTSVIVEHVTGCHSDDGKFMRRTNLDPPPPTSTTTSNTKINVDEEDLERYDWYWGEMSREDCTQSLKERGIIGNFVVRKNNRGDFVMTFWRKDAIHHHRILRSGNSFQFEKSVVQATGENIPDLLDTYMKCCTDKTIGPYGGQLYPNYDNPWNPPDIDFEKMSEHLQKVKQKTGKKLFKPGPGMGDHTYGGLTLNEMNSVINSSSEDPTLPPSQPVIPIASPKVLKSPPKKSPKPQKGVATPFLKPGPQPSKGYVNVMPIKPKQEEEEEEVFSDDDQEVYIQPGSILEEQEEPTESPLYQNTVFNPPNQKQNTDSHPSPVTPRHDDSNIYQNFVPSPPTPKAAQHGLYANVQFNGKPYAQPRQRNKERRT